MLDVDLPNPFPRMGYDEAMARYGSDKPDLRVALELTELTDVVKDVEFKVFREAAQPKGGRVAALRVPGGGTLSRSEIDALHRVREGLRREGPRLHQGERARAKAPKGCSRRYSSS